MRQVFAAIAIWVLCSVSASVIADSVNVTEVPDGWEFVGASDVGAHVLRLSKSSGALSWSDSYGNTFLTNLPPLAAVEVSEANAANRVLYPREGAKVEIGVVSAEQVDIVSRSPDGFSVTWTVTPRRLGLKVNGTEAAYTLRLRYDTGGEGIRLDAGGKSYFPTAGVGALADSPQLVVDAKRSRAMSVMPPTGSAVTWALATLYSQTPYYLLAETTLKRGQTLWLSTEPVPSRDGLVEMGLYRRNHFHRDGGPAAIATLSSAMLQPGSPMTLTFKQPIETAVKNGIVLAGLMPVSAGDPADSTEDQYWYFHGDAVMPALMPLEIQQDATTVTLTPPASTPSGPYRMRVWIVPRDLPRPEALGGTKGAVAAFFPGFSRTEQPVQQFPSGDVFVSIHRAAHGSLSVSAPDWRRSFWRGEMLHLLVQARADTPELSPEITLRDAKSGKALVAKRVALKLINGCAATELTLWTRDLAPGEYRAEATADGLESYDYTFTIAPPRSPGMALVASPLYGLGVKLFERLGPNVFTDIMPGVWGYAPAWRDPSIASRGLAAGDPSLPLAVQPAGDNYDDMVSGNWFWLQGIQSRQLDYYLFHSIPEHVEETYRKHLVYAQFNQRVPSMLGLVFGYDLAGVNGATSWGPEWETFGTAGTKRTLLLNARWDQFWKDALAKGATPADEHRAHNLFKAGVIEEMYAHSVAQLHDYLPGQRHTSSNTADHATMEDGMYMPSIYRPLDFRYIEVWNDQVYLCSAHDMQESFWASLLRMEKPPSQPLWVTVPIAPQPGTHLRRALQVIGRGATGVGYCVEGAAGLGPVGFQNTTWGADPTISNIRTAEARLTGDMADHYGAFFNQFAPHEEVAILYSVSQGGFNFGTQSPVFFAYYTLAQLNRPAQLLTEDQIAGGALSNIKALVLVHQTNPLPPATLAAIERFAASGGTVIADRDTTLPVKGMKKLPDLFWHTSLWPAPANEFHQIISAYAGKSPEKMRQLVKETQTFCRIDLIPRTQPKSLLAALGDAGRQPLEVVDGDALVISKTAGDSTLVMVSNENVYPFHQMFTDGEMTSSFFRYFLDTGFIYYKDVRVPRSVMLRLRDDLAATPPRVYDVFAGRELRWQKTDAGLTVSVDLATLQGRALLLAPHPIESPSVLIGAREKSDTQVKVVVRSAIPLPVRIRVANQEVFRAATEAGSSDTFAIGPLPRAVDVEVTDLITGRTRSGTVELTSPIAVKLEELPAVQVRDATRVRRVLAEKGLAIYVDPRQSGLLAAAKSLAAKIPGAEIVFNPRVEDYVLDWDLPPDLEAINDRIRTHGLLGRRRPIRYNFQWMGALTPATVWSRPAVVFGNAGDNSLIADMNAATLLPRPATLETIGPGRAVIGVAGSPFWNDQDVVYALAADRHGSEAALEKLAAIASGESLPTEASDDCPRAERRQQLGFEPLVYPAKLAKLRTEAVEGVKPSLDPCIPVAGLIPINNGVLVALGTPGHNLIGLDDHGRERFRTMTAGFYQPIDMQADAGGESVVRDEAFTWRHDASGKLHWKTLGTPATPPLSDGSVWVQTGTVFKHVSAAGEVLQSVTIGDKVLAITPDGRTALTQRPGKEPNKARVNAAVVAIDLASGKQLWNLDQCEVMESRLSGDGKLMACVEDENLIYRDDMASSRVSRFTVLETATGRVLLRAPIGEAITGLVFSADSKMVMASEAGLSDLIYLANVETGLIRRVRLPEAGGWAHAFSYDGKTLWVACEKLYRIDVDSLQIHTIGGNGRVVQLAALPKGMIAGTADGRVVWLSDTGERQRSVDLAGGIGVEDIDADMAILRDAKLVDSPSALPHEFPDNVNLVNEFPRAYSDPLELRGDAVMPICVGVHVVTAGRYRFTVELHNAKTEGAKMGVFHLTAKDGPTTLTAPINGDQWHQAGVLELTPGTWIIRFLPQVGWAENPLMREMKMERVE